MGHDVKVAESTVPITLTEAAVRAAKEAIVKDGSAGDFLRVSISGGGCSGYQYNLDFEKGPRADDTVITLEGLSVLVDPVSGGYLRGTVIDYLNGEDGSGFKFDNPNPRRRLCGCGSSWA